MIRAAILGIFGALLIFGSAFAAPDYPTLSGRVVDAANILSQQAELQLEQQLAEYEAGTTNQVVVATIPSLQDVTIEEYGIGLARLWQIGQHGKDNGALLIVAPNDRKVRIEVGYGLEGLLTDAASYQIIHAVILPKFREARMEEGVILGTKAMLAVLGGKSLPITHAANTLTYSDVIILFFILFVFIFLCIRYPSFGLGVLLDVVSTTGGSGGSGGGGGGFSGGGGGFGGGGASGGW